MLKPLLPALFIGAFFSLKAQANGFDFVQCYNGTEFYSDTYGCLTKARMSIAYKAEITGTLNNATVAYNISNYIYESPQTGIGTTDSNAKQSAIVQYLRWSTALNEYPGNLSVFGYPANNIRAFSTDPFTKFNSDGTPYIASAGALSFYAPTKYKDRWNRFTRSYYPASCLFDIYFTHCPDTLTHPLHLYRYSGGDDSDGFSTVTRVTNDDADIFSTLSSVGLTFHVYKDTSHTPEPICDGIGGNFLIVEADPQNTGTPSSYCALEPQYSDYGCPTASSSGVVPVFERPGQGTICVTMDNGQRCPFTEVPDSATQSTSTYLPDYSRPEVCQETQEPPEEPAPTDPQDPDPGDGGGGSNPGGGNGGTTPDPGNPGNGGGGGNDGGGTSPGTPGGGGSTPTTPDDNLPNPQTPASDMTKQDFKDVMRGAETRLDSLTSELQGLRQDMQAHSQMEDANFMGLNDRLRDIDNGLYDLNKTLKETLYGDELKIEDGDAFKIADALGVSGNESWDDLNRGVVSIDQFRAQYQPWLASSQCPPERSIEIMGKSYTLSWTPACELFSMSGILIIASAWLLVPFIIFWRT